MIKRVILAAGPLDPLMSSVGLNFQKPMESLGIEVIPFDFPVIMKEKGRDAMNGSLVDLVKKERPDLVFFIPQTSEFTPEMMRELNRHTITLAYFFDDMWRMQYARHWAGHYRFFTTSDVNGLRKYESVGIHNALFSPLACNPKIFRKLDLPLKYDVTFVGQYHPQREWFFSHLKKAGIRVEAWGANWPNGMTTQEEMIRIFNQSRINLNVTNNVSWDLRGLFSLSRPPRNIVRTWRHAWHALTHADTKTVEQVKGRHMEIPACGGFQLSYYVEGLERLYTIGEEIAIYATPEDLVEKVEYYLSHEEERLELSQRGYQRTLREHSMEKRIEELFLTLENKS